MWSLPPCPTAVFVAIPSTTARTAKLRYSTPSVLFFVEKRGRYQSQAKHQIAYADDCAHAIHKGSVLGALDRRGLVEEGQARGDAAVPVYGEADGDSAKGKAHGVEKGCGGWHNKTSRPLLRPVK
jgi:hypothetical protein